MKETGYHKAMKKEFENRVALKVKRQRMTDAERKRLCDVRRRREALEEDMRIEKQFKL